MIILLIILLFLPQVSFAGVISDAANALSPGQFSAWIPVSNPGSPGDQLTYMDSLLWDSVNHQMRYIQSGNHQAAAQFVTYDLATNAITSQINNPIPRPPGWQAAQVAFHTYDNETSDYDGNLYIHLDDQLVAYVGYTGPPSGWGPTEWIYSPKTQTWTGLPANTARRALGNQSCCDAYKFFPERHGIYLVGNGKLWFFNTDTQTWSFVQNVTGLSNPSFIFAEYNRISKIMLFIDPTSRAVYQIDQDGTVTQKSNFPFASCELLCGSTFNANLIEDPATGNFFLINAPWDATCGCSTRAYSYNTASDTWTLLSATPPPTAYPTRAWQTGGFAIPELNVVAMFTCGEYGSYCAPQILLYKPSTLPTADADFAARRGDVNVTNSVGFDSYGTTGSKAEMICCAPGGGGDANLLGNDNTSWTGAPTLDTGIKRSGAGSMKITAAANVIKAQYGQYACCGDTGIPGATTGLGHHFTEGSDLYVQYAVRFSPEYFDAEINHWGVMSKIAMFYVNNISCGAKEISTNTNYSYNVPAAGTMAAGYFACGVMNWATPPGSSSEATSPNVIGNYIEGGAYDCPYGPFTNCFQWPVNKWITLYYHVRMPTAWGDGTPGGAGSKDATMDVFYSIDGEPYVRWIHMTNIYSLACTYQPFPCPGEYFNNIVLPIYLTGGADAAAPHDASVWYDELIVSTKPIASPAPTSISAPPPVTAVTLRRRIQ